MLKKHFKLLWLLSLAACSSAPKSFPVMDNCMYLGNGVFQCVDPKTQVYTPTPEQTKNLVCFYQDELKTYNEVCRQ